MRAVVRMHLFWQCLQVSPILRCLLKEVLSALGKWAVPCSDGISGAGAGSSPSVPDQFFLSHLHNLNVQGKKNQQKSVRREVLFQLGVQVPQPPYRPYPSSMLPAERC